ncbi:MAG TPA: hypothetical protein PLD49_08125 [Thermoclostridium caenicola]|mgnify:CR=1 FL=1|uniref:Uncharacterized protein n=1 Tax=Thermoclostridium caenicola TaxID=659425 RepID=A0A1M6HSD3_9FIRM|nr:hypothetical protein [Thermoclostridium caenicola]SHJ25116.1 hypothetical protein SAMN05444373_10356 [Thermoclostridium caenicola]HOK43617.1 hypothetical protein [Thermoclostridium caenicola]HOL85172.1 hypothetical protein [Thermoclostridium caenicola]HOP72901.1 hypothetical protein [Thermoclostridium caenicola]HPO75763.1 hypothetical protein [Thermoclostridium caenicola]
MNGQYPIYSRIILLVIFLIVALASVAALSGFWSEQSSTQPEEIRQAILDACVQCYALEGSYPPSLEYLEEHYGLILDRERYFFYYEVFASNVLPTVEVYKKE